ncbi:MAG: sodium-dependent transporter [Ruminiclostridium sp.]
MSKKGSSFSSKLGFVLATAGSAVGLGNIWRFPYLAAQYGGGIFLLVYIILAVTFGFALMITEIAIGRKTGKTVIGAYTAISRKFSFLGILAAAVPVIIFPYYCVIGGWVIKYFTVFISGQAAVSAGGDYFNGFIGSFGEPALFLAVFMGLTAVVVMLGVEKGIEKVSKFMMPALVLMTIAISIYSLTLPGAIDGLLYYVLPDFSHFSFGTVVAAMGQLFYSMSIAMGILVTYGSYMRKDDNLESSVCQVEIFDTGVAFLSGMMIIPAVFAFSGGDPNAVNAGPSLMFITLPNVFTSMAGGEIVGAVFFVLVLLAALTSSISLMETIVSVIMEKFRLKRMTACIAVIVFSFILGLVSVLGYSDWKEFTVFGMQMLDFFDFISNNIMMPVVSLVTCILIGYVAKTSYVEGEVELNGKFRRKAMYRVMIKYIAPVFMILIFIFPFIKDYIS